jgi:hypothetical protein
MKLTFKLLLIIYLLVSSFHIDLSKKVHRKRNYKAKTSLKRLNRAKITKEEKLKAFFIGFVTSGIATLIKGKGKEENPDTMKELVSGIVENCTPVFFNNYDTVMDDTKKKKGRRDGALKLVFKDKELEEILPVCNEQKSLEKLNDNEYSTLNLVTGWLGSLFVKNPFMANYDKFRAQKQKIQSDVRELTHKYKTKMNKRKDKLQGEAKRIAENMAASLEGTIMSNSICEALDKYYDVHLFDHLEALLVGAMKGVVCGSEVVLLYYPTLQLSNLFENLFRNFGISMAEGAIATIFPPALAGFIINFIWQNLRNLTTISKYLIFSGNDNEERDLYQSIGGIAGGQVFGLLL